MIDLESRKEKAKHDFAREMLVNGSVETKIHLISKVIDQNGGPKLVSTCLQGAASFTLNLAAEYAQNPDASIAEKLKYATKATAVDIAFSTFVPHYGVIMFTSSACSHLATMLEARILERQHTIYNEQLPGRIASAMGVNIPMGAPLDAFLLELSKMVGENNNGMAYDSMLRAMHYLGIEQPTAQHKQQFAQAVNDECLGSEFKLYCTLKAAGLPSEVRNFIINSNRHVVNPESQEPAPSSSHQNEPNGINNNAETGQQGAGTPRRAGPAAWERHAQPTFRVTEDNTWFNVGRANVQKMGALISNSTKNLIALSLTIPLGGPFTIIPAVIVAPAAFVSLAVDYFRHKARKAENSKMCAHYEKAIKLLNHRLEEISETAENGSVIKSIRLKTEYDYRSIVPAILEALASKKPIEGLLEDYNNRRRAYFDVSNQAADELDSGAKIHRELSKFGTDGHHKLMANDPNYAEFQGLHHECRRDQKASGLGNFMDDTFLSENVKLLDAGDSSPAVKQKAADYLLFNAQKRIFSGQINDPELIISLKKYSEFASLHESPESLLAIASLWRKIPTPEAATEYSITVNKLLSYASDPASNIEHDILECMGALLLSDVISIKPQSDGDVVIQLANNKVSAQELIETAISKIKPSSISDSDMQKIRLNRRHTKLQDREKAFQDSLDRSQNRRMIRGLNFLSKSAFSYLKSFIKSSAKCRIVGVIPTFEASSLAKAKLKTSVKVDAAAYLQKKQQSFYQEPNNIDKLKDYVRALIDNDSSAADVLKVFESVDYLGLAWAKDGVKSVYEMFYRCVDSGFIDSGQAMGFHKMISMTIDNNFHRIVENSSISSEAKVFSIRSLNKLLGQFVDYSRVKNYMLNELHIKKYIQDLTEEVDKLSDISMEAKKSLKDELSDANRKCDKKLYTYAMDKVEIVQYLVNYPAKMMLDEILRRWDTKNEYAYVRRIIPVLDSITEMVSRYYEYHSVDGKLEASVVILSGGLLVMRTVIQELYDAHINKNIDWIPQDYVRLMPIAVKIMDCAFVVINTWSFIRANPLSWGRSAAVLGRDFLHSYKDDWAKNASIPETYVFSTLEGLIEALANNPALRNKVIIDATIRTVNMVVGLWVKAGGTAVTYFNAMSYVVPGLNLIAAGLIVHDTYQYGTLLHGLNRFTNAVSLITQSEELQRKVYQAKVDKLPALEIERLQNEAAAKLAEAKQKMADFSYRLDESQVLHIEGIYARARLSVATNENQHTHLGEMNNIIELLKRNEIFDREKDFLENWIWGKPHLISKDNAAEHTRKLFYSFYYHFVSLRCDRGEPCSNLFGEIEKLSKRYIPDLSDVKDEKTRKQLASLGLDMEQLKDHMNAHRIHGVTARFMSDEVQCDFDHDCQKEYDALQEEIKRFPFHSKDSRMADSAIQGYCASRLKLNVFSWNKDPAIDSQVDAFIVDRLWRNFQSVLSPPEDYSADTIFSDCKNVSPEHYKHALMREKRFDYVFTDMSLRAVAFSTNIPGLLGRLLAFISKGRVNIGDRWHLKSKADGAIALYREFKLRVLSSDIDTFKPDSEQLRGWAVTLRDSGFVGRIGSAVTAILEPHAGQGVWRTLYHILQWFFTTLMFVSLTYDIAQSSMDKQKIIERIIGPMAQFYFVSSQLMAIIYHMSLILKPATQQQQGGHPAMNKILERVRKDKLFGYLATIAKVYSHYSVIPADWKVILRTYKVVYQHAKPIAETVYEHVPEIIAYFLIALATIVMFFKLISKEGAVPDNFQSAEELLRTAAASTREYGSTASNAPAAAPFRSPPPSVFMPPDPPEAVLREQAQRADPPARGMEMPPPGFGAELHFGVRGTGPRRP